MDLSSELISELVKITNDENKDGKKETTVYGTIVEYDSSNYVQLDGSDLLTPVITTADIKPGDRVMVVIKNHTAVVTGNVSSPSASSGVVREIGNQISEFEIVIAGKVDTVEFNAEKARIEELRADNVTIKEKLTANEASIQNLEAQDVTINGKLDANEASIEELKTTKLDAKVADLTYATIEGLEATNADIHNLDADYASFKKATTDTLTANDASIKKLNTDKLSVEDAKVTYANIDFSNIGEAAIKEFYAKSGVIRDVVISEGQVTGKLVGVTIKGDLIEGGTVVADKLVIQGEDGLYYKLNTNGETVSTEQTEYNSLSGTIITAKSITAEKVSVDDLVAFDATIGGFNITDNSIYSGVKSSIDNTTKGIYLDNEGQVAFGDSTDYIKYYKDTDGTYKLEISAKSIKFASSNKSVEEAISDVQTDIDNLEIGGRNYMLDSVNKAIIETTENVSNTYEFSDDFIKDAKGRSVTISAYYEATGLVADTNPNFGIDFNLILDDGTSIWSNATKGYMVSPDSDGNIAAGRYVRTITLPDKEISGIETCSVFIRGYATIGSFTVKDIKIELGNRATDWTPAPEDIENTLEETNSAIQTQITDTATNIEKTCDTIILSALESYVQTGDYEEFKNQLAEVYVTKDEVDIKISNTESITGDLGNDVDAKFEKFYKYFTFSETGLSILESSGFELQLDSGMIQFIKNGKPIGRWDGVNFYTGNIVIRTEERAQFGNFAFVPRGDGSLQFLKVGDS